MRETTCYNIIPLDVFQSQEITPANGLLDWSVTNKGAVVCIVNGAKLLPPPGAGLSGESMEIESNEDEYYKGKIMIQFEAGAGPWALLVQRYRVQ